MYTKLIRAPRAPWERTLWRIELNQLKGQFSNMPKLGEMTIQKPATFFMYKLVELHNNLFLGILGIGFFVIFLLYRLVINYSNVLYTVNRPVAQVRHNTVLEFVWTLLPCIFLIILARPSLSILAAMDGQVKSPLVVKVIGNQWYWVYEFGPSQEYFQSEGFEFESRMILDEDLDEASLRLLTVDKSLFLPTKTNITLYISSYDVLHSWTIPAFGVKLDACPGRLNRVNLNIARIGVYYGQCSEICGTNHAFMPIVVKAVSLEQFWNWVKSH